MAKISFNKLNLKVSDEVKTFEFGDSIVEVKQYLSQDDKIDFIGFVMDNSIDNNTNTFSPVRTETFFGLAIVKWYTNITFTDKQIEDAAKTYDKLESSGFLGQVIENINQTEYDFIEKLTEDTLDDYSRYANSAAGILQVINSDASSLSKELDTVMAQIRSKQGIEELTSLKNIMG